MPEKAKVPAIRFKGFTDAWEQRKVGEILIERNIQAPKSDDYPLMAFIAYEGVTSKGDRYNRESLVTDEENKKYKQTEFGDFIYSSNNLETGSIGLNNYGKASISPVYSIFKPTALADSDFIGRRLVRKDFIIKMVKWRQGVIYGQWRIHEADFIKIDIAIPSVAEQQKIGVFLRNLDNLITLHQRKLLKLKNIKKAMLGKMFPKDGNNVPEIRFAGFTEAWEKRKLGEVAGYRRGSFPQPYGKREWYDGPEAMPFVQIVDVTSSLTLVGDTKQKISKLAQPLSVFVKTGSVIVTLQGSIGRVAITQYDAYFDRTILIFENYKQKIDLQFWAYIIQQKFDVEKRQAPGGTIKTITKEVLSDFDMMVPEYDEQKQIGTYFKNLDNLITLHQHKYEKLQSLKKACLEKMFV